VLHLARILRSLQDKRLKGNSGARLSEQSPIKKAHGGEGVRTEEIRSAEDPFRLPMTGKEVLRDSYPLQASRVPSSDLVEMHMSSGSTGTPWSCPTPGAPSRNGLSAWPAATGRWRDAPRRSADHPSLRPLQRRLRDIPRTRAAGLFVILSGRGTIAGRFFWPGTSERA
jgi:phenylacetate-CoA ligase